jgi:hypothetical protein
MAEQQIPERNTIPYIDYWVSTEARKRKFQIDGGDKIDVAFTIPQPPLQNYIVYKTSGNENDCMIHSLLIDLSPTFRKLGPDDDITTSKENRDTIARLFRTSVFANIPGVNNARALGNGFLEDGDMLAFGNYYSINILVYNTGNRSSQLVTNRFRDLQCIMIQYNGINHYSAMSTPEGSFFITYDKAEGFARSNYENIDNIVYCEYSKDEIINYEGQSWIVDQRLIPDDSYGRVIPCNKIRIRNNGSGVQRDVNIRELLTPEQLQNRPTAISNFITTYGLGANINDKPSNVASNPTSVNQKIVNVKFTD